MKLSWLIGLLIFAVGFFIGTEFTNTYNSQEKSFANALRPSVTQMASFGLGQNDTPVLMLNLLKFKDKAVYEDGRETNLSGRQAYSIYRDEVINHLEKVGAEPVIAGSINGLIIGEIDELWDVAAIVRYPSKQAMLKMIMDKEYLESEKHRAAGLEGQLNIEVTEGFFGAEDD